MFSPGLCIRNLFLSSLYGIGGDKRHSRVKYVELLLLTVLQHFLHILQPRLCTKSMIFLREFVKDVILLCNNNPSVNLSKEAEKLLQSWGNRCIAQGYYELTPGPYYYKDNALWQVMRLYEDYQGAFLISIKPEMGEEGKYEILNDGNHGW